MGRGERPSASALGVTDDHGLIAERYPSGYNVETLGPEYERAWVAAFEGSSKVVGPSEHGFEVLDVERFSRERPAPGSDATRALAGRVDGYWSRHRDRREDTPGAEGPSPEELERLRALGYAE